MISPALKPKLIDNIPCRGGGASDMFGVSEDVDIHTGTMSKAIGSQGGFLACKRSVRQLIMNRGRPYVFSTALALPSVAAASAAIQVFRQVCLLRLCCSASKMSTLCKSFHGHPSLFLRCFQYCLILLTTVSSVSVVKHVNHLHAALA